MEIDTTARKLFTGNKYLSWLMFDAPTCDKRLHYMPNFVQLCCGNNNHTRSQEDDTAYVLLDARSNNLRFSLGLQTNLSHNPNSLT